MICCSKELTSIQMKPFLQFLHTNKTSATTIEILINKILGAYQACGAIATTQSKQASPHSSTVFKQLQSILDQNTAHSSKEILLQGPVVLFTILFIYTNTIQPVMFRFRYCV